ncbi:MAG: hypothetical protein KDB07_12740, partial [Planctomycetes bacterium]|nr:hypothetical protein [Planctomycetota bacterium]
MRNAMQNKFVLIAGLFALGMVVLLVRLWTMQVSSDSQFIGGADNVRLRRSVFFPSRARILDAKGNVIADNVSAWEVHFDYWKLLHPERVLQRSQLAPDAYPSQAELLAFSQSRYLPTLRADYGSPKAPKLFFALWSLRQEGVMQADRQAVIDLLSKTLDLPYEVVESKFSMIESEVDALSEAAKRDPERVSSYYIQAKKALREGTYWQDILRFPKSMRLEHALAKRVLYADQLEENLAALAAPIDERPELAAEYLGKAIEQAQIQALSFAGKQTEDSPISDIESELVTPAFKPWP